MHSGFLPVARNKLLLVSNFQQIEGQKVVVMSIEFF